MGTNQAAINPPSDVNLKDIRQVGGKGGRMGERSPSPGRGEREDGSGASAVPDRKARR